MAINLQNYINYTGVNRFNGRYIKFNDSKAGLFELHAYRAVLPLATSFNSYGDYDTTNWSEINQAVNGIINASKYPQFITYNYMNMSNNTISLIRSNVNNYTYYLDSAGTAVTSKRDDYANIGVTLQDPSTVMVKDCYIYIPFPYYKEGVSTDINFLTRFCRGNSIKELKPVSGTGNFYSTISRLFNFTRIVEYHNDYCIIEGKFVDNEQTNVTWDKVLAFSDPTGIKDVFNTKVLRCSMNNLNVPLVYSADGTIVKKWTNYTALPYNTTRGVYNGVDIVNNLYLLKGDKFKAYNIRKEDFYKTRYKNVCYDNYMITNKRR